MSSLLFHVNSVMIFICIFIYVYTDMMSLSLLVLFEYGSAIAGLFLWSCIFESPDPSKSTTLFFQHCTAGIHKNNVAKYSAQVSPMYMHVLELIIFALKTRGRPLRAGFCSFSFFLDCPRY